MSGTVPNRRDREAEAETARPAYGNCFLLETPLGDRPGAWTDLLMHACVVDACMRAVLARLVGRSWRAGQRSLNKLAPDRNDRP